jgi:hypothetical protein
MVFKIYAFGYRSESFSKRNDNANKIIQNAKCKRIPTFKLTSIIISVGIFTFSIAGRFDKHYSDNIFADADPDSYRDSKKK